MPPTRPTFSCPPPATSMSITHDHMKRMKNQAIVCNIGHFDNEIEVAALRQHTCWTTSSRRYRSRGVSRTARSASFCWPKSALGEPRLLVPAIPPTSCQVRRSRIKVLAQIELFGHTAKYPVGVYVLPETHLDVKGRASAAVQAGRRTHAVDRRSGEVHRSRQTRSPTKSDQYRYWEHGTSGCAGRQSRRYAACARRVKGPCR